MTDAALSRAWTAFGGASLALMGVSLAGGACRHAADAAAWQRQRRASAGLPDAPAGDPAAPALAYRLGGAALGAAGLGLAAAAALGRGVVAIRGSRAGGLLGGAFLALCGLGLGGLKLAARPRGPRFLAGEALDPARGVGERAADAATWALCALWTVFGLALVREFSR